MLIVGGAKEQCGGGDGAAGDDHNSGGGNFHFAFALDLDAFYFATGGAGFQACDFGVGEQGDVGIFQRGVDAEDVGIGFGVDEAGVAIAGAALDAGAVVAVGFVEADAQGSM